MSKEHSTAETPKEEFKNDQVRFHVHHRPHCVIEYEVEADKQLVLEARKKATRAIGKDVLVPGFRKGKAPPEIVAKRYPQDLDRKWQEEIATASYRACADLAKIPLVRNDATISFKMHKHSPDGAKLTLSFETAPNVPSIDPSQCELEKIKRPETGTEKIEETVRQAQLFFAKWHPILDRPIQEGDFVILNVDIVDPPERLFTNTRFEVTDTSMARWMKKLVLGQKQGASIEGVSLPDEDLPEEEKKHFKPKKVRIHIHAIETADIPPLDDQFAKQLGVDGVDHLKQRIATILNKQSDDHVLEALRGQVTEYLLSIPFDLPQFVIEQEARFRLQQMMEDASFKRQWEASTEATRKGHIDNVMRQAEKAVRLFYLCRKIASDHNISVTPKDLPLPSTDLLEALLNPGAPMHDPGQPDIKQAEAFSRVLLEKTEDWIIDHAKVKEEISFEENEKPKPKEKKPHEDHEEKNKPKPHEKHAEEGRPKPHKKHAEEGRPTPKEGPKAKKIAPKKTAHAPKKAAKKTAHKSAKVAPKKKAAKKAKE